MGEQGKGGNTAAYDGKHTNANKFFYGPDFVPGGSIPNASLLDIAPTIAEVMGIIPDREWEGRPLINR